MHYKNTVEAIYISLEEVQGIISEMGTDQDIRTIDIDLASDKVRHIYDLLNHLKSEVARIQVKEEKIIEEPVVNKVEEDDENVIEFDMEEKTDTTTKNIEQKTEVEVGEKKSEKKPQSEPPQRTQAEIDSRVKLPSGKKFLGETFEKKSSSLNEELSKKINPSKITEKLTSKPISNIGSALGLNEKFEIIKNLFDGDKDKYEYTLQVLNAASDFNEAYEYISSKLNWDMDNLYVQKILELIRRKLIIKKNE